MMVQDNLAKVKNVGPSRLKLLNDHGINTLEQLVDIPLEKLAGIKSIGQHYAKLIKNSANEFYRGISQQLPATAPAAREKQIEQTSRDFQKAIKRLKKNLSQADEKLKPLWQRKYLENYLDFKKRSAKLKAHLNTLDHIQADLPQKVKKTISKKADALTSALKKVGKKPKKRRYKETKQAIQSFSRKLRDIIS